MKTGSALLFALFLAGCAVPTVDVTPGPPGPGELIVVEVSARGSGGHVALHKSNVRSVAPSSPANLFDSSAESFRRWRQAQLDSGHLVYSADLEPGQTASDVVYHIGVPDEPMMLDVRWNGTSIWTGRVGTKIGGTNHLVLVVENGVLVETSDAVVEAWLGVDESAAPWALATGWKQPDDHVKFELERRPPESSGPPPVPSSR